MIDHPNVPEILPRNYIENTNLAKGMRYVAIMLAGIALIRFSNDDLYGASAEVLYALAYLAFSITIEPGVNLRYKAGSLVAAIGLHSLGSAIDSTDFLPISEVFGNGKKI